MSVFSCATKVNDVPSAVTMIVVVVVIPKPKDGDSGYFI